MTFLPDINVWLALASRRHQHHLLAQQWIAEVDAPIAFCRITQMGLQIAQRLGLCAVGRATNKRFLCFSAPQRLVLQPELAGNRTADVV